MVALGRVIAPIPCRLQGMGAVCFGDFAMKTQHRCGHAPTTQRLCQSSAEKIAQTVCDACYSAYDRQNAETADICNRMGLPYLTGSPRQVAWANSIRLKMITRLEEIAHDSRSLRDRRLLEQWREETSAAWWIANRG